MESNEYKIERWDVVQDERTNIKRPILYILPHKSLIDFAKLNNDSLYITMRGTGIECYDGIKLKASLVSSSIYPNNRPNFFERTGYYVIVLKDTIWLGYPKMLGAVIFEGKIVLPKEIEENEDIRILPIPTSTTNPTEDIPMNPTEDIPTNPTEDIPTNPTTVEGFFDFSNSISKSNLFLIMLVVLFIILFVARMIINRKK